MRQGQRQVVCFVGVAGDTGVASGFGDPSSMRTVSGSVGVASGFGDPGNMRTVSGNVGDASGSWRLCRR